MPARSHSRETLEPGLNPRGGFLFALDYIVLIHYLLFLGGVYLQQISVILCSYQAQASVLVRLIWACIKYLVGTPELTVWIQAISQYESNGSVSLRQAKFPRSPLSNCDNQNYYCPNITHQPASYGKSSCEPKCHILYGWPPNGHEGGNLKTPINRQLFGQ